MNTKAKGTKGERELIKTFNENGWSAIRSAGSGSSPYPAPDILAGNAVRRLAIECKVTKENKKYLQNAEIDQLQEFSRKFGAEPWVGVKFPVLSSNVPPPTHSSIIQGFVSPSCFISLASKTLTIFG